MYDTSGLPFLFVLWEVREIGLILPGLQSVTPMVPTSLLFYKGMKIMKQDLSIVRGTSNSFGITVKDADGKVFTLETGQVLVFALKKRPKDEDRVLVKKIINIVNGEYYLEL